MKTILCKLCCRRVRKDEIFYSEKFSKTFCNKCFYKRCKSSIFKDNDIDNNKNVDESHFSNESCSQVPENIVFSEVLDIPLEEMENNTSHYISKLLEDELKNLEEQSQENDDNKNDTLFEENIVMEIYDNNDNLICIKRTMDNESDQEDKDENIEINDGNDNLICIEKNIKNKSYEEDEDDIRKILDGNDNLIFIEETMDDNEDDDEIMKIYDGNDNCINISKVVRIESSERTYKCSNRYIQNYFQM